jgi:thioesterase domain-containing protein/glycine/D-amino acid oxidase-like deaminating enzyme
LTLDTLVPPEVSTPISFGPGNAPRDLAVVLARDAHDPASVLHLRSLVYDLSGRLRRGEPLPPEYDALAWAQPAAGVPARRRVCVVGGGPAGLTAAWELERLGHEVTVFEREPGVGGMAASVTIDGRPYDLGAHLCTGSYETIADLARTLGVDTEPTTGYFLYEARLGRVVPQDHSIFGPDAYDRYQRCRQLFPAIDRPGLAHSPAALGAPVRQWLCENGLDALAASMGPNYTAAGYGYLDDPDVSALYLLKFSEMIGALSPRRRLARSWTFTIRGGFQTLWQRLAQRLRDVRCGVPVDSIERTGREVVVKSGSRSWTFDDLVVAVPPRHALAILDADAEERELFAATRTFEYVTTVCRTEGLPKSGLYLLKENSSDRNRIGHSLAFHHRHAESDVYLFYAYGNDRTDAELDAALAEDVVALGGALKGVELRRRFQYMPHPDPEAIRAGFFTRLEGRQGKRRTYYAGSLLGFELTECVAAHARVLVQGHFGGGPDSPPEPTPAVSSHEPVDVASVERWLARELAAELDLKEPLPPAAALADYRIDSVTAAAILGGLSQWLGRTVPPYMVFDQPTIAAIARAVVGARPVAPAPAAGPPARPRPVRPARLLPLNDAELPPPVFLVGGLMGSALYLRELARNFPPHQPVLAFQAAGLDGAEEPFDTVAAAAEAYLAAARGKHAVGPYRVVGHSFGGLVAYEMACRLHERGEDVELTLLDTLLFPEGEPPQLPDEDTALGELLMAIRVHKRPDELPDMGAIARLSPASLREQVTAELAGSRPFAGGVVLGRWLRVYDAHSSAMRAFRPRSAPGLNWTLVKARAGYPRALMHPARTRYACYDLPRLGWERVDGSPGVATVPGNHFTMVVGGNALATARAILRHRDEPEVVSAAGCG